MSTKKRVAIFHNLPGGGSYRVMQQHVNHLVDFGYEVDVYCTTEKNQFLTRSINNVSHTHEYKLSIPKNLFLRLIWILFFLPYIHKKIAYEINKKSYQYVIVNHDYLTKSPYVIRSIRHKKIYVLHEPQREFYEPASIHAPHLKKRIANIIRYPIKIIDENNTMSADHIICNSMYSKKRIKKIYKKDATLLYPAVDQNIFKPSESIKKENLIIVVGTISKVKGQDFVIKSLLPILGEYKLIVFGKGGSAEIARIRNITKDKNRYIEIIENGSDEKLVNLYRRAKVLCIGAHLEPFGLTSIEAQSTGTPVVAVNEGGIPETVIDGKTGYLSDRDPVQFLNKTKKALNNYVTLGKYAVVNAKRFNINTQKKNLRKVIQKYVN